jgi:hypothetical protein
MPHCLDRFRSHMCVGPRPPCVDSLIFMHGRKFVHRPILYFDPRCKLWPLGVNFVP